ncbi:helix-turn-helix domain-containing protein [Halobacillus salinarum]|uniref:Helix-turn-helix domain-containing protein n=1 Tax=Halobacillus salinarum TaxID=2932257 RepID=A0ABY4EGH6_9BACI|nr:helix-turn-helix domain-containing protein [Halobacillus salinarum]UOQ42993.1 helix-turn-helix domain-containing protein [Halobacillus salinarum]
MEMDIGTRLREAREKKEMPLEQVQEITKIQKRYLQAIENNDFKVLPGKFYTRAFIREYASAVGLDPEVIMQEHKSELPEYEDENLVQYSRVQKASRESASKSSSGISKVFPTIMTVVLIVFLLFVAWAFITQIKGGGNEDQPTSTKDENEVSVPESQNDSGDGSSADQNSSESENNSGDSNSQNDEDKEQSSDEKNQEEDSQPKPEIKLVEQGNGNFPEHTFEVKNAKESSLTVEISGQTYLEVSAPKNGENLTPPKIYSKSDSPLTFDLKGQKEVYVKIGSAKAVTVKIDDQEVEYPINPDQLVTQKFLLKFK